MRMSIGLSVTKCIITALDALAHEMQPAKKTRSGAAFEEGRDDSTTVKHLRICGGWPDWQADYDHNGEAIKDHSIKKALWLQGQLGAGIAMCAELESLTLQNMQWYAHKNRHGLQRFFANLRRCAKLSKLALVNNTSGGCFLDSILPELLPLPLRVLDLRGNRLFRDDMYPEPDEIEARERAFVALLATLARCKTLHQLSLADMNLSLGGLVCDDMTTRMLIRLMHELPCLNRLDLRDNEMTELGKAVLQAAKPPALVLVLD
jgi:hypothetical protein